jgi:hypothetical protein
MQPQQGFPQQQQPWQQPGMQQRPPLQQGPGIGRPLQGPPGPPGPMQQQMGTMQPPAAAPGQRPTQPGSLAQPMHQRGAAAGPAGAAVAPGGFPARPQGPLWPRPGAQPGPGLHTQGWCLADGARSVTLRDTSHPACTALHKHAFNVCRALGVKAHGMCLPVSMQVHLGARWALASLADLQQQHPDSPGLQALLNKACSHPRACSHSSSSSSRCLASQVRASWVQDPSRASGPQACPQVRKGVQGLRQPRVWPGTRFKAR